MTRFTISFAIVAVFSIAGPVYAFPGAAPVGTAIADYNPATGEIAVSINGVNNWLIESASFSLTGDEPSHSPIISGSLSSNDDYIIGETAFAVATGTNVSLGNVAATGLDLSDLTITWNAGLGVPAQTQSLFLWQELPPDNFFPTARINGPFTVNTLSSSLNILLDASASIDDGLSSPLNYKWDLDNNGVFEVNTGTDATLAIADVTSTFGGVGSYPVAVEVFDGEFWDVASTTLNIVSQLRLEGPGPSPPVTAIAQYDPTTGQIVVSARGVPRWTVLDTNELAMTGETPLGLPAIGSEVIDNDAFISVKAGRSTITDLDLGYVALQGLADDGTLLITWQTGQTINGIPVVLSQPIVFTTILTPEPTSLVLAALGLLGIGCRRRRRA